MFFPLLDKKACEQLAWLVSNEIVKCIARVDNVLIIGVFTIKSKTVKML